LFLLTRQWRVAAAAVVAALAQLSIGWWHYGTKVMSDYIHALMHANDFPALLEPRLYQTFSLRGFWLMLVPWPLASFVLYITSGVVVLWVMFRCWQNTRSWALRYAAFLLATVLVAPHGDAYDLVILAPAFLLLGDWTAGHSSQPHVPEILMLLYVCYPLFLLEPLTRITHLQLGVLAMAALLWMTLRAAEEGAGANSRTGMSMPLESV
jgi:hypothetical protein